VVVHGEDGLDEVTLAGQTSVTVVEGNHIEELIWTPADFGLTVSTMAELQVAGPEASAELIHGVLDGAKGPARDIVVLNAAAAIWTAGKHTDLRACASLANTAIESGAARDLLSRLSQMSDAT
jgi:anthranilate phosphoribosyltransferase